MSEQLYNSEPITEIIKLYGTNKFTGIMGQYFDLKEVKRIFGCYQKKKLNDVESIGILLITSTYILHNQFFGSA